MSEYSNDNTTENMNEAYFSYKTKEGSILLQQHLLKSGPEEINTFISDLQPVLADLAVDPYANYAIQTLVQSSSVNQRATLIRQLGDDFLEVSCHPKGTHVIQSLVSLCSSLEEEKLYIDLFKGRVLEMSMHHYAGHVMQKLMNSVKNKHHFVKEIAGHAAELAFDKYGVCVINTLLKDPLILNELLGNALALIQDAYGNYTMQLILDIWKEEVAFPLRCALRGRVAQLCMQKYSSNVIEVCLKDEELREVIISELVLKDSVNMILGSPFGGYVVKTALLNATELQAERLRSVMPSMGKQVEKKRPILKWPSM